MVSRYGLEKDEEGWTRGDSEEKGLGGRLGLGTCMRRPEGMEGEWGEGRGRRGRRTIVNLEKMGTFVTQKKGERGIREEMAEW
jgi:hypothetical protein